jgi:hypothetical protein
VRPHFNINIRSEAVAERLCGHRTGGDIGNETIRRDRLCAAARERERGRCAGCHGADLRSTDREVPHLTGDSFKRWIGKSVGEKFEDARDTMPPRDERSLPDQVYLDVITFILRFNKVPVGSQELKPDPAILKQIKISDPG